MHYNRADSGRKQAQHPRGYSKRGARELAEANANGTTLTFTRAVPGERRSAMREINALTPPATPNG
jgi:hypothetical protein